MTMAFIILATLVFFVFLYYVFDIRKKEGMTPLVSSFWTILMKLISMVMLVFYLYLVVTTESITASSTIALILTAIGAGLVATAKITLGKYHTWVGYHKKDTTIVTHGIYSRLRHPLYTGIILFEIGSVFLIYPAVASYPLGVPIVTLAFAYMVVFNIYLARLESGEMQKKFGVDFEKYENSVRAFIPIRKSNEHSILEKH